MLRRLSLVVAVIALTAMFTPAQASNWFGNTGFAGGRGTCFGGNMTDNGNLVFSYVEYTPKMRDAADWVRANRIDPTVLSTSYTPNPTDSTDVLVGERRYRTFCEVQGRFRWYENPNLGNTVGLATCDFRTANGRCDQAVARFSRDFHEDYSVEAVRANTCHEFGHTIGLAHREFGCMRQGNFGVTNYTDHDRQAHFTPNFGA